MLSITGSLWESSEFITAAQVDAYLLGLKLSTREYNGQFSQTETLKIWHEFPKKLFLGKTQIHDEAALV